MNAASSFHLWWRVPEPQPLIEAAATCEVLEPPKVDRLYFWALQVGFHDGRTGRGGAHTGLQWHSQRPPGRAVNWGGYRDPADGGGEFDGSLSSLPRLNASGNTMSYPWEVGTPYRLRVRRTGEAWRATVTDSYSGQETVIRDLDAPGPYLVDPVVWSEVFADCDDPSVTVRWSDLVGVTAGGTTLRPESVVVTYQSASAGGCRNTTVAADHLGVLQTTNARRTVRHGEALALPLAGRRRPSG